ncbi:MAG: hypothetical protein SNI49_07585 [Rikenellaceae bacterium]
MGTIITICIIVGAIYYFKSKKKTTPVTDAVTPVTPSEPSTVVRFTTDSDEEYVARIERFSSMLQVSPKLQECYDKIVRAFVTRTKLGKYDKFYTTSDRVKLLSKTAEVAIAELNYDEEDYRLWSDALYDDILGRMCAKPAMGDAIMTVMDDVNKGNSIIDEYEIEDKIEDMSDGDSIKIETADGTYKVKIKIKKGEITTEMSGIYSIFKYGVSLDVFMRRAEILIAICGILNESFFIMFYESELPSYQKFMVAKEKNCNS